VRGLFLHDFQRARHGRLGPYGTKEWLLMGGAALTSLRAAHKVLPYVLNLDVPASMSAGESQGASVSFAGKAPGRKVHLQFFSAPDVTVEPAEADITEKDPSVSVKIRYAPNGNSSARAMRSFVAVRASDGEASHKAQIYAKYFQGTSGGAKAPPPAPAAGASSTPSGPPSPAAPGGTGKK
jgi:hypothetical protein